MSLRKPFVFTMPEKVDGVSEITFYAPSAAHDEFVYDIRVAFHRWMADVTIKNKAEIEAQKEKAKDVSSEDDAPKTMGADEAMFILMQSGVSIPKLMKTFGGMANNKAIAESGGDALPKDFFISLDMKTRENILGGYIGFFIMQ